MQVKSGDRVKLRDGRIVDVTDAADAHPDAWRTYDRHAYETRGEWVVTSEMPPETIFVGRTENGGTVVSDMSEVVSILN